MSVSLLSQVKKGKIKQPFLGVIYGTDGVGKSTFGAQAPSPIFLGTEKGTANLDVARFPSPKTFADVMHAIVELTTASHEFKTLVIDSLDWLEPLVWDQVCADNKVKSIEEVGGGFGKGYLLANKKWQEMMSALSSLRDAKDMNIILVAHSQMKTVNDPHTNTSYDRYQLKLNDKASALWREFVDFVLFANFEVTTKADKSGKTRAYGDGARYFFTERRPSFDAKSRVSVPFQLPLGWTDLQDAIAETATENPEVLKKNILALVEKLPEATKTTALEKVKAAGDDPVMLDRLQKRLIELVNVA